MIPSFLDDRSQCFFCSSCGLRKNGYWLNGDFVCFDCQEKGV